MTDDIKRELPSPDIYLALCWAAAERRGDWREMRRLSAQIRMKQARA